MSVEGIETREYAIPVLHAEPKRRMWRHYARILSVPLLLLVLSFTLRITWDLFSFPAAEEFAVISESWFARYGLPVLFGSAIFEGMLLVGGYFPGVFVIFLGIILTTTPSEAAIAVAVATAGLFIAHLVNYALGRYGWYRLLVKFGLKSAIENEREKILKRGPLAILLSYWLPSAAAITDTAAGITRMPFKTFVSYSLASVILWDAIGGTLIYIFKDSALSIVDPGSSGGTLFYAIIGIWIAIVLAFDFWKRRSAKQES